MDYSSLSCVIVLAAVSISCCWSVSRFLRPSPKPSFPPGPSGFPVIGNLLDIPTEKEWLTFSDWGRKYGPVTHIQVLGRHIIILNTLQAINDLLERRSLYYSSRPYTIMVYEMMQWGWMTNLKAYGEELQRHHAFLHKYLQPSTVKNHHPVQLEMTHRLLEKLLESPEEFMHHIRSSSGAIILKIVYGYEVAEKDDIFVSLADEAVSWLAKAAIPGRYWIDFIPWLRYVPDWFPGSAWKSEGRLAHSLIQRMIHLPYEITKQKLSMGKASPCIMAEALSANADVNNPALIEDEKLLIECLASFYVAGADTSVQSIQSAILALVLYPEIQSKAQAELDRVVGRRLPTFSDRGSLPYVEGIVREALRWNPVGPSGGPRTANAEDNYLGYRIPAGSTIIPNLWAASHDDVMYPEPTSFRPERWLDGDGNLLSEICAPTHPNKIVFGCGRRICPGRHLAEDTIFIGIASVISVFNVEKAMGNDGLSITPDVDYRSGIVSQPKPFECRIIPRSLAHARLVRENLNL